MPIRKTILAVAAVLLLNAQTLAAPSVNDWTAPPVCVFGMPVAGSAVQPDNRGLLTDILTVVFEPEGYDLVHRDLPYVRALSEVAEGKIQCTLTAWEHVESVSRATSVITLYSPAVGYIRAEGFHGVDDLAGQKVAHLHGFDVQDLLPVEIRPQPTYDLTSVIHMLDRGHVRYVIADARLLRESIAAAGLPSVEFGIAPLMTLNVVPIFSPDAAGRRLRDIYDRRMGELASSGKLAAIYRNYGLPETFIREILKANGR